MSTLTREPETAADTTATFTVRKVGQFIGSEVSDIDLVSPLSAETVAALRALLLERGVLFFRDQHLSPEQQIAFTRYFGNVRTDRPARHGSPAPGVSVFDSRNGVSGRVDRWHADGTHVEAPSTIKSLNIAQVPENGGGDTMWVSTEAAYDRLSPQLQRLAETLTAIHATTPLVAKDWPKGFGGEFTWSEHPVVAVHPETGRKSLFVSPRYTPEIVGLRPNESASVLKILFNHITLPEHQVRFTWTPGSIVLWDNRITQHYAVNDYGDDVRVVHSVSIEGEPRVGVDGQRSRLGASLKTEELV